MRPRYGAAWTSRVRSTDCKRTWKRARLHAPRRPRRGCGVCGARLRAAGAGLRCRYGIRARGVADVERPYPSWLAGAIGALRLRGAAFALTPLGGYAGQLLTIFEPKQFVPIEMAGDSNNAADAESTASHAERRSPPPSRRITSLAGIDKTLGFEPRSFDVPASAWPAQSAFVQMPFATSYTFSAAKARAYESQFKRTLPAMPPGLDGTTFRATYGPVLRRNYFSSAKRAAQSAQGAQAMRHGELDDMFVFVEMKVPSVTSTGARWLTELSATMPNVPPSVAQLVRAISDPAIR